MQRSYQLPSRSSGQSCAWRLSWRPSSSESAAGADSAEASAAATSSGGAAPGVDHETESHGFRAPEIRAIFKTCMHVWAADGSDMIRLSAVFGSTGFDRSECDAVSLSVFSYPSA
jgi:hypothetical protein